MSDRKLFGMPQCPRQFRIYLQIEIGICIIYNLIYFKLIKTHQPICLIKTVLANQRRLLQSRQTGVIGIDRNISGIINTSSWGAGTGQKKEKNILIRFGRGTYNHLRTCPAGANRGAWRNFFLSSLLSNTPCWIYSIGANTLL